MKIDPKILLKKKLQLVKFHLHMHQLVAICEIMITLFSVCLHILLTLIVSVKIGGLNIAYVNCK